MCKTKEIFIENLIEKLNEENKERINGSKEPLDVCYMVSAVDQGIENCKEFIKDINNHTYCINGYEEDDTQGYTNGKIRILIEKPEDKKESECLCDTFYDYCYYIEFLFDDRDWGYCYCSPGDENYNEKHKCCGMGCDWTAPAFRLTKETDMMYSEWEGYEKDYWEYEERFNKIEENKNKNIERYKVKQQKQYLEEEIKKLQNQLKKIDSKVI